MPEGVKRLFYIQNSFAAAEPAIGKAGEFTQAGIELIGEKAAVQTRKSSLFVKALCTAGLKEFAVDIGQVQFFKALVGGLALS